MGHRRTRRTRRNRRTKNRRYRRQKGGENIPSSNENKNEENKDSGIINSITGWFNDENWIPDSKTQLQSAGRRRRKHRRTYKK
jgi:hypothetical protein